MKGNIGNLMKQAQAMQANMQKAQAEIANMEVEGVAGGGMVKVTHERQARSQARAASSPRSSARIAKCSKTCIAAAINDAVHKVEAALQEKMSGIMGGMKLPPGFKLPF